MQWPSLSDLASTDLPPTPAQGGAPAPQPLLKPFVCDDGNAKSLHFTMAELQSRMNKASPWQLEVDYTRTMMGFLLLRPVPAHIVMVGLGGGSLAKFCHRQLPGCRITVVEINPHVIALRRDFAVPDDDARFQVMLGDGAEFVAAQAGRCDVLLVDGFDHEGQPEALCSPRFYDDCFAALTPDGVLAVNLHYDDADYPLRAARLARSFGGNAVEVPAPEKSNCIVFASRGAPLSPRRISLPASLAGLDREARRLLRPELARVAWALKDLDDALG